MYVGKNNCIYNQNVKKLTLFRQSLPENEHCFSGIIELVVPKNARKEYGSQWVPPYAKID